MADKKLVEGWTKAYRQLCDSEFADECDFEHFCWGWCVANGLTLDQAYEFFREMVKLNLF